MSAAAGNGSDVKINRNSSGLRRTGKLFYETLHSANAADYSPEQLRRMGCGSADEMERAVFEPLDERNGGFQLHGLTTKICDYPVNSFLGLFSRKDWICQQRLFDKRVGRRASSPPSAVHQIYDLSVGSFTYGET